MVAGPKWGGGRVLDALDLDLDVDTRRQVQPLEGFDGLARRLDYVEQALVDPHLEVLPRVLVDVRAPDDAIPVDLGRQRHRATDPGAGAHDRLDDLLRRLVDDLVVVRLEPDADLLGHGDGRSSLLDDLRDATGADGAATLSDGEPQTLFHGDRLLQLHRHLGVVTGHDHLGALGQVDRARDVGGPEVELRVVVGEERRVPPALLLREHVDLRLEVGVGGDRAGLGEHLAALDLLLLRATEQGADVVAGLALVEDLAEHLDTGAGGLLRV